MQPASGSQRTTLSGRMVFWTFLGMLAATEKVAELMIAARESFWRSVIGVPPAGRAVSSNVAVTTEVQNYSIVVVVKTMKGCSARHMARDGACNPSWVMCVVERSVTAGLLQCAAGG